MATNQLDNKKKCHFGTHIWLLPYVHLWVIFQTVPSTVMLISVNSLMTQIADNTSGVN